MRLTDIYNAKNRIFSLEVFPPKKTTAEEAIYNTLYGLKNVNADFISVTYGAGGSSVQKKKTVEMCSLIKEQLKKEPLMHLTCVGCSKNDIDVILEDLIKREIFNILVLRGDIPEGYEGNPDFLHASDLASYIKKYDSRFDLSGACYPEGHPESENLDRDIENLKTKVDSGVGRLVTQLFFDNGKFYSFMDRIEKKGINVPVEAGIMPITKTSQIERIASMCGAAVPADFSKMVTRYASNPEDLLSAGVEYAVKQIEDLYDNGVKGVHLYTMNSVKVTESVEACLKGKYL